MTRALPAAVLLLVLTVSLSVLDAQRRGGPPESDSPSRAFTLGVLRRDGLVLPFAAFTGRRWITPWPAELAYLELPISLESIDPDWWGRGLTPPKTMTLWADGKPRGDLSLGNPTFVNFRCARRIGLRTNYHAAEVPPPPTEQPYPKDGLVVAGAQQIDAIEGVPKDSVESREIAAAIAKEFNDEETYANGSFTNWRHPVSKSERAKVPIEIESLYRAPMDAAGWTAYYVEAVKKYPPGKNEPDGCGLLTTARGFVRAGPKGERRVELGAQITYCDRYGLSYMLPLGLVRAGGGAYWIYQNAGYLSETYVIVRPTPGGVERAAGYSAEFCPF